MTVIKRSRSKDGEFETLALTNCLMLLSRVGESAADGDRLFSCKTCNRKFPSFQALGGHRASHKRPRLVTGDLNDRSPMTKPSKSHECSICGQEFAIGQALGGHMRRHRAAEKTEVAMSVQKKSSSGSKRVLSLDLNLTPFENDVMSGKSPLPSWFNLGVAN